MELSATHLGDLRLCAVLAGRSLRLSATTRTLATQCIFGGPLHVGRERIFVGGLLSAICGRFFDVSQGAQCLIMFPGEGRWSE